MRVCFLIVRTMLSVAIFFFLSSCKHNLATRSATVKYDINASLSNRYLFVISTPGTVKSFDGYIFFQDGNSMCYSTDGKITKTCIDLYDNGIEWLNIYTNEKSKAGGAFYGGAVLITADNVTVSKVNVDGGMIGVAIYRGGLELSNIKIFGSTFTNMKGWGIYVDHAKKLGVDDNTFTNINRVPCKKNQSDPNRGGCESAAMMLFSINDSEFNRNKIVGGGNGMYFNGEGNRDSKRNKINENSCDGALWNCFEMTFANDVQNGKNVFTKNTTSNCDIDFWVGCSNLTLFGFNDDKLNERISKGKPDYNKYVEATTTGINGNKWTCNNHFKENIEKMYSCPGTAIY